MQHNLNTRTLARPITLRKISDGSITQCESVAAAARLLGSSTKAVRLSAMSSGTRTIYGHHAVYAENGGSK